MNFGNTLTFSDLFKSNAVKRHYLAFRLLM